LILITIIDSKIKKAVIKQIFAFLLLRIALIIFIIRLLFDFSNFMPKISTAVNQFQRKVLWSRHLMADYPGQYLRFPAPA